jgi:hypothetical protein
LGRQISEAGSPPLAVWLCGLALVNYRGRLLFRPLRSGDSIQEVNYQRSMEREDPPTRAEREAKLHAELNRLMEERTDVFGREEADFDRIREILEHLEKLREESV